MSSQENRVLFPEKIVHPRRRDIFLHGIKTTRLIMSLLGDPRVALWRKVGFFLSVAVLIAVLAFPDALEEIGLSIVFPLVGTILGIPLDAGFDWLAVALLVVSFLRIFPAYIVSEHYSRLFLHQQPAHTARI